MTEAEWDAELFSTKDGVATVTGWTSYHTLRSKGSRAGFPDRVAWRDRVIYVELKADGGVVSNAQGETLTALARAGAECYVWWPSDRGEVDRILAGRWTFVAADGALVGMRVLRPASLWIPLDVDLGPSGGRRDFLDWMAS